MKRVVLLLSAALMIFAGCSKDSGEAAFSADAPEYEFFKSVADSIPAMNPEKEVVLIRMDCGDVTNFDIMPDFYRSVNGQVNISDIPSQYVKNYIGQIASSVADKKLFMADAEKENVKVSEDEIQAELETLYANPQFGNEEAFLNYIEEQGFSIETVRNDIHDGLMFQHYLEQVIDPDIVVSEDELKAIYNEPKSASVRHILLSTQGKSPEEKAEILTKMEGLLKRARAGEDFAALAKEYTEDPGSKENGGLYENFGRGQMVPAFDNAAFTEPVGSITDIVETQFGYHILKIENRISETRPFDDVKEELRQQLLSGGRNQAIEARLNELKDDNNFDDSPVREL